MRARPVDLRLAWATVDEVKITLVETFI